MIIAGEGIWVSGATPRIPKLVAIDNYNSYCYTTVVVIVIAVMLITPLPISTTTAAISSLCSHLHR